MPIKMKELCKAVLIREFIDYYDKRKLKDKTEYMKD